MAVLADVETAIGCLSTVYPEFVSKELATLTDSVLSAIQGFTDPLAALGDIQVDSLVGDVKTISEGDIFDNLGEAAIGLTSQYVKREAEDMLADIATEHASPTKRVQEIRNLSNAIVSGAYTSMALFTDMPYAVAQKMCETIIGLDTLKITNLQCLRKHIVQLTNSVLVLVENATEYKDNTITDLRIAKEQISVAHTELGKSQVLRDGKTIFDQKAFERAQEAMVNAKRLLTPDKNGTSILDVADILTSGSVEAGHINRENQALVHIAIPSLVNLIQVEISAVVSQIEVINFYVTRLAELIGSYRSAGSSSRIQTERSRAINSMSKKLVTLCSQMELAVDRGDITAASIEMLSWSSKVKAIISTMDKVNVLTLQEGSVEGPDKAFELENALAKLLDELASINNETTTGGIEDPTLFRDQVLALTKYATRIVEDISLGEVSANTLATFHLLAAETAGVQISRCDESVSVAAQQILDCREFAEIDIGSREKFDDLLNSMRQVGLDRAVDMLGSGQFTEFLESDLDSLSYVGASINCLTDALGGIDDTQTRKQITDIRDDMVARKANEDLATADSADQGRSRFLSKVQKDIASIQKNAKTVESIVGALDEIRIKLLDAGQESIGTLSLSTFKANLDHLQVGAGGRLAEGLEEFSEHPNAGVPLCEPV